jgi:hypothetical protein
MSVYAEGLFPFSQPVKPSNKHKKNARPFSMPIPIFHQQNYQ